MLWQIHSYTGISTSTNILLNWNTTFSKYERSSTIKFHQLFMFEIDGIQHISRSLSKLSREKNCYLLCVWDTYHNMETFHGLGWLSWNTKKNFMLKLHCKHFSYSNVVGGYDINYNKRWISPYYEWRNYLVDYLSNFNSISPE